jgi:DNA-binding SARP family transcriptional activator
MTSTHLTVLGRFACHGDGRPLLLSPRGERLLAYLALHRRAVRRDQLAGVLWGDTTDERASANLRSTLWRLPRCGDQPLVDTADGHVALSDHVVVDLWTVEGGAADDREQRLVAGDLLPGWDDEWVAPERERYRQLRLHALEDLCCEHRDAGRYADALRLGLIAVASDPLRETAHRRVIEVHIAEGNVGEALRQYDRFRVLLRDELGLPPSPTLRDVIADLLDADPRDADPCEARARRPRSGGGAGALGGGALAGRAHAATRRR